jgi:hypothetical protein
MTPFLLASTGDVRCSPPTAHRQLRQHRQRERSTQQEPPPQQQPLPCLVDANNSSRAAPPLLTLQTPQRPPLPRPLTSVGSGALAAAPLSNQHSLLSHATRDSTPCLSACSSLGTCSSMGGEDDALLAAALSPSTPAAAAWSCPSSAAASRRASLLSDASRASGRRSGSLASNDGAALHDNCDSSAAAAAAAGPQQLQQQQPAPAVQWAASPWSHGSHAERNGRPHMEDRVAARDVTGRPAFARFGRAGFFAVFDG